MPLPIPNLDDRSFDDLMKEAISLIPVYNKEWTNYNPSDPGITLLELFAWLSDMVIYRVNQVPEENYKKFLKLIGIELGDDETIDSGIRRGLESISQRYRAITADDYEFLSMKCMDALQKGLAGRAICMNNRDLEYSAHDKEKPGHVSVIIIPRCSVESDYCTTESMPTDLLKEKVKGYLDIRRLITTRVHVVGPFYQEVKLEVWLALKENTLEETVKDEAKESLKRYFDPLEGGQDGKGWPLGRNLYRSELYHILEGIAGVDHVVKVLINGDEEKPTLEIEEHKLILLKPEPIINLERVSNE